MSNGASLFPLQNAPLSAFASVLSPATVPVPCASAYTTVDGSVFDSLHTRSSSCCCVSPRGLVMAGFAPSWFTPHPRITAYTRSPASTAARSDFSTTMPAPSQRTYPLPRLSKEKEWPSGDIVPQSVKPSRQRAEEMKPMK